MRRNGKCKFLILNLNFAFLIFNFSFAHAWQVPVEVSAYRDNGEKVYNKLIIGVEPGATNNFDNLWATPALTSHPDPDIPLLLKAYLNSKGSGKEDVKLWKDIRGVSKSDTTWDITIDSLPSGKAVIISWVSPFGMLKTGERLVLKDNEKVGDDDQPIETDITEASSYAFLSDEDGSRSLSVVFSKESTSGSKSGGGSGFGCGTVRFYNDAPPAGGSAVIGIIILFSPVIFFRLIRNRS